jgi:hypothetical protein
LPGLLLDFFLSPPSVQGQWQTNEGLGFREYRHGLGILYAADGSIKQQGRWRDNKYIAPVKPTPPLLVIK